MRHFHVYTELCYLRPLQAALCEGPQESWSQGYCGHPGSSECSLPALAIGFLDCSLRPAQLPAGRLQRKPLVPVHPASDPPSIGRSR